MQAEYFNCQDISFFSQAQNQLDVMIQNLNSAELQDAEHGDIERYIQQEGFELLRLLLQGHLGKKANNEPHLTSVTSADGVELTHVRHHTKRKMSSLFGDVTVHRKSYSKQTHAAHFPMDEQLNLADD
ncbi:ISKra4 family transposase, partial [Shewanella sp. 202IG2-18]|nr:ISKra4 family transposase [Parashewanella hymeniacidonis]